MEPRGTSDPPRATFIGDAWENPSHVTVTVTFTTRHLLPNQYPADRAALADRIIALRDDKGLTFKEISLKLSAKGKRGARGAPMDAKGVFSIYKKRKAYLAVRNAPLRYRIDDVVVYPLDPKR